MIERVNCKICDVSEVLSGTRLCHGCWNGLRYGEDMLNRFQVDIEIKMYRNHSQFRWSVDLMTDDLTYGHSASTLEDALAGAAERMRNGE